MGLDYLIQLKMFNLLLGDFFEAWIGDDYQPEWIKKIILALQKLIKSGTNIFLMRGNRDFLIGTTLCEQIGCTLIEDIYLLPLKKGNILMMHGDLLCTEDKEYQSFRLTVRELAWQKNFLLKPLHERLNIAKHLREASIQSNQTKNQNVLDVTEQSVLEVCTHYNVKNMIHGHTHKPKKHEYKIRNEILSRWVLSDWHKIVSYVEINMKEEISLKSFPL